MYFVNEVVPGFGLLVGERLDDGLVDNRYDGFSGT